MKNKSLYAVIGNPIAHSLSPQIHTAFAQQTQQDLEYDRLLGDPERFAEQVRDFIAAGGKGLSVTVPFKEIAWRLMDHCSERATLAKAVNTIALQSNGQLFGDNTDGIGLINDLQQHAAQLKSSQILLLGAGGAARGIIAPLLHCQPTQLTIANRTVSKAERLANEFNHLGAMRGCGFADLEGQQFSLIINATAAGLDGKTPAIPTRCLTPTTWCYDLFYSAKPTPFVRWAQEQGVAKALDGLGMLVEQAAEAFWLWRGVRPDPLPVIAQLRIDLLARSQ